MPACLSVHTLKELIALATSSGKRSVILPDVLTISETGVPGYETANWWGVAAPRGTPPQVVDRLNAEIKAVLLMPDTEKRLINEGAEPALKTPAELGSYVAAEMAKWVQVAHIRCGACRQPRTVRSADSHQRVRCARTRSGAQLPHPLDESAKNFPVVVDHAEIRALENLGIGTVVDCDDGLGCRDSGQMLGRT